MIFIESYLFTKQYATYLSDDEYSKLQTYLIIQPDAGDLIQGTHGLRKLRWRLDNKGKRGGLRIIYYWNMADEQIYLMTLYAKNEMSDLSANERKALKLMIERWKS